MDKLENIGTNVIVYDSKDEEENSEYEFTSNSENTDSYEKDDNICS